MGWVTISNSRRLNKTRRSPGRLSGAQPKGRMRVPRLAVHVEHTEVKFAFQNTGRPAADPGTRGFLPSTTPQGYARALGIRAYILCSKAA